ncbi:MAG: pentapeptide repeat-containing protein, partial [bacterium]
EPTTLPVINVNVSMEGFFILAPLLSIFFFIYLQIYLSKLNRLFVDLRGNYRQINEAQQIYPWMLNFANEPEAGWATRFIVNFSVWWSLPLVLMVLALSYLKKHEPVLGSIISLMPLIGTLLVLGFWRGYSKVEIPELSNESTKPAWRLIKLGRSQRILLAIVLLFEIVFFAVLRPRALTGEKIVRAWVWPNVDVSYENLISKQDTTFATLLYWGNFNGAQLQGANFTGAILMKADLREADLRRVNFTNANLKNADLRGAKLQNAILTGAILDGVKLDFAELQGARCEETSLLGAQLNGARVEGASFRGANLRGVNFIGFDLQNVDFFDAKLQFADFSNANIEGVIFRGARLNNAIFSGVSIDSTTDFRGAALRGFRIQSPQDFEVVSETPRHLRLLNILRSEPLNGEDEFYTESFLTDSALTNMLQHKNLFDTEKNRDITDVFATGFEIQHNGLVVVDTINGLICQKACSKTGLTYKKAQAYVDTLNAHLFAGFDDWRLPTLEETKSLILPKRNERTLYLNPIFAPRQMFIWTADKLMSELVWVVRFDDGSCFESPGSNPFWSVRAVLGEN